MVTSWQSHTASWWSLKRKSDIHIHCRLEYKLGLNISLSSSFLILCTSSFTFHECNATNAFQDWRVLILSFHWKARTCAAVAGRCLCDFSPHTRWRKFLLPARCPAEIWEVVSAALHGCTSTFVPLLCYNSAWTNSRESSSNGILLLNQ